MYINIDNWMLYNASPARNDTFLVLIMVNLCLTIPSKALICCSVVVNRIVLNSRVLLYFILFLGCIYLYIYSELSHIQLLMCNLCWKRQQNRTSTEITCTLKHDSLQQVVSTYVVFLRWENEISHLNFEHLNIRFQRQNLKEQVEWAVVL